MIIRKGYSDGPEGQVHWRMADPGGARSQPDLYCFSPAPFGSIAYANILPHLAQHRRVIAPDYPGQGGSDGGSAHPAIEDYAASMCAVIEDLSGASDVYATGFHSGCLVAVEVALRHASDVKRLALVDVPAFDPPTRAKYLPAVGAPFELSADLESLSKAWDMAVTKRSALQPLEQCLALFADTAGNGPRMNATFHAAFTYDVDSKFAGLQTPTTILATKSMLLEPSRRAAQLISNCSLVELLDIQRSVLDESAVITAAQIGAALRTPASQNPSSS